MGFLGIYGKVCEDNNPDPGCHIEVLNKTGVNFKHGYVEFFVATPLLKTDILVRWYVYFTAESHT